MDETVLQTSTVPCPTCGQDVTVELTATVLIPTRGAALAVPVSARYSHDCPPEPSGTPAGAPVGDQTPTDGGS